MQKAVDSYRLFFALWPETDVAAQIYRSTSQALKACAGRRIPARHLHITLAFIGSVDTERLHCVQQAAARIRAASFELNLERLGYWPRSHIVWLAPTEIPPALLGLQADLSRTLADMCAYQPETRPFRPHLSLARKARHGPDGTGFVPLCWQIRRFSLIRSHTRPEGADYEVVNHWPLGDLPTEYGFESI